MRQRTRPMAQAMPDAAKADTPRLARRSRAALCATTALQAAALLVVGLPARAQPAPNARPVGGQVSSGSAAITGNALTTLIRQSSQNAVVNWQSFNVGSAQSVQYAQPGASSFTLNRVISASPSQIAGHILANGRIAIVNQSGVVFLQGSTVDTAGLVVSAAGITDQDFMAGRLVFVQPPQPGAVVSNAGNITIRQAGLAALVAPQVANSGTITAVLGRVVLGGAATHTLDMYGDGLVALNVTGQVTQVQLGGRAVTALVTNTGTILAPGGTVVLTAQAADGVVSKLISAGGTISAPTLGGQSGRVLVSGVGGDIEVDGAIQATGASGAGGSVTVTGNRNVTVASGGVLDASGAYGGGAVSLSAASGNATVASGAVLRARGTLRGRGGRITVQAGGMAGVHGTLDASGATTLDPGGTLAISGGALSLDGLLSASLPGQPGGNLDVMAFGPLTVARTCGGLLSCISFATLQSSGSSITDTNGAIEFAPNQGVFDDHATNVLLTTVFLDPKKPLGSGDITFGAGTTLTASSFNINAAGSIVVNGQLLAPAFVLTAAKDIDDFGQLAGSGTNPATSVSLSAGGTITEQMPGQPPSGTIDTSTLVVLNSGTVTLDGTANNIGTLSGATASGSFNLADSVTLEVTHNVTGGSVELSAGGIKLDAGVTIQATTGNIGLTATAGTLSLAGLVLTDASGAATSLTATGGDVSELSGASIQTGTLMVSAIKSGMGGAVSLDETANTFTTLSDSTASGALAIGDSSALTIASGATVSGASVTLDTGAFALSLLGNATVQATDGDFRATGDVSEAAGALISATGLAIIDRTLTQTGGTLSAGTVSIGGSLGAGNTGVALMQSASGSLHSDGTLTVDGAISQTASTLSATGSISASSLMQTSSTVSLGGAGGTITLSGDLTQDSASTLTATGGTLALTSGAGSLFLGGLVSDTSGTVSLTATSGVITQLSTGRLIAGMLSAQAGQSLTLVGGGANQITTVKVATATGAIEIGEAAGGTLIEAAGGNIASTSGGVTLNAALLIQESTAKLSGTGVTVDGAVMQVGSDMIAATAGDYQSGSVTQSAGSTITAQNGSALIGGTLVQHGSGVSAGTMVSVSDSVAQDTGSSISGGTVVLVASGSGTLSQAETSSIVATVGPLSATLSGDLTQDSTSSISGANGNVTLTSSGGTLYLGGMVTAAPATGTLTLMAGSGAITEAAMAGGSASGTLVGGKLVASARDGIDLSTASGSLVGNQVLTLGNVSTTGGTLLLADGVPVTVAGMLSAPDVYLRTPTLTVTGAIDITGGGTLSIGADSIRLTGSVGDPNGLVAIGLLHPGTFAVVTGGTIDPAGLAQISTGPNGTIALGTTNGVAANGTSTPNATWTAMTAGAVSQLTIGAALDLSANAGTLGLFSNGGVDTGIPSNAITVAALYGAAATDFLAGSTSNSVSFIGSDGLAATAGSLVLGDAGPLEILSRGTVSGSNGVTLVIGGTLTQDSSTAITSIGGSLMLQTAMLVQQPNAGASGLAVTITGGVSQAGTDTITASAGDYQSGSVFQSGSSSIAAPGGSAFIGGTLTQQGSKVSAGSLVQVSDSVTQTASSINGGAVSLLTGTLQQMSGSSITATAGLLSATLSGDLMQSTDSLIVGTSGNVSLTSSAGALLLGGLVQSGSGSGLDGSLTLAVPDGTVTEASALGGSRTGRILAGTVTAQAGTMGGAAYDLLLDAGANRIGTVASAFASGQIALDDTISLVEAASGAVTGAKITLTLPGLTFTQGDNASLSSAGGVLIDAAAMVQDSGASATAQAGFLLTGSLLQTASTVIAVNDVQIGGALTQLTQSTVDAGNNAQVGSSLTQTASAVTAGNDVLVGTAGPAGVTQVSSSITGTFGVLMTLSDGVGQDAVSSIASPNGSIVIHSTGGTLALGGTLRAAARVDLVADAGDVTQAAPGGTTQTGTLQAASLGVQAGTHGGAPHLVLLGGQNSFLTLVGAAGSSTSFATGNLTLDDTSPLTLASGTTLSAGGDLAIALAAPSALTQGSLSTITAGGLATLEAASVEQQTGATLTAASVSVMAGLVQQDGQDSITATGGNLSISGSATQTTSAMTATGDASIGGMLGQSGSTLAAGGAVFVGPGTGTALLVLDQAGSSITAGGDATLYGAATQDGSSLTSGGAAMIYGSLGQSSARLSGASVTIGRNGLAGTLSQIASTVTANSGDLTVTLFGDLTQDSRSSLASPAGNILLTTTGGGIALGGLVSVLPSDTVNLVALGGDITQTAPGAASPTGTLLAGTLSAQAGTAGGVARDLVLDGAGANEIGTISAATATGTLLLVDAERLVEADSGVISGATGVTLRSPGVEQMIGSTIASTGGSVAVHTPLLTQDEGAAISAQTGVEVDGSLAQANTDLVRAVTGDVTLGGNLDQMQAGTVRATLGDVSIGGTLGQANRSILTASGLIGVNGSVTQFDSEIFAGSLAIGGSLSQANGMTGALTSVSIGGDMTQYMSQLDAAGASLIVGGSLTQQTNSAVYAATPVSIRGNLVQSGSTLYANGALTVGGLVTQTASDIAAGSIHVAGDTAQSASTLTVMDGAVLSGSLGQSQSLLSAGGGVFVGHALTQDTSALTAGGALLVGGLVQQTNSQAGAASVSIDGGANQSGSTLTATGDLSIAGGIGQLDSAASAGGTLSIAGGAVRQTDGSLSGAGAVLLGLTSGLTQDSASAIASSAGDVSIATADANLEFAGLIASASSGRVALQAGAGAIAGTGTLRAGSLAAQASGNVSLTGTHNQIAAIDPVNIAGGLALAGVSSGVGAVTIEDSIGLLLQGASISGVTGVGLGLAGDLAEAATGTIASSAGPITIGSPGILSFSGLLQAPQIVLGGPALSGRITLLGDAVEPMRIAWNGGMVLTNSAMPVGPGEPNIGQPISPNGQFGAFGLFATARSFSQTGTTRIGPLPGARAETVVLTLVGPGGLIAFDPSTAAGLFAPGAQLLLDLQAAGRATGNIDVAGLNIYTGQGSPTGGASLTGLVDGRSGSAAAATGFVHLLSNVHYQDNGCPVQSLNCVLLSPVVVPLGNPVQNLVVAVAHDQDEDDDLILPNVAEQDY